MARLTAPACRAARALLGWSMRDLREKAGVALATVQAIEAGGDFRASTGDRIVDTFSAHGVEVLNGDNPGARLAPLDRSDLNDRLESVVEAMTTRLITPETGVTLRLIEGHARADDQVPGQVRQMVSDLTGDPAPGSYREVAVLLLTILPSLG